MEPYFDFDENNSKEKEIYDKITALTAEDRSWPNFLNRHVKDAGILDASNPNDKERNVMKALVDVVNNPIKSILKSAAHRTRSEKFVRAIITPASHAHSLSSDTMESSKEEKEEKDDKELEISF